MTFDWDNFDFKTIFENKREPKLLSIGMEGGEYTKHPRIMHTHTDKLEMLLITQGNGIHMIDGETYYTAKGDLLIYNSNSLHDEKAETDIGMKVFYLAVTDLAIEGLPGNCLVSQAYRPVIQCGDAYEEMERLFSLLFSHVGKLKESNIEFLSLLMKAVLARAYDMIMEQSIEEKDKDWELGDAIKKYIDKHYQEDVSLQTMAEDLNMIQYYLAHAFNRQQGIPRFNMS